MRHRLLIATLILLATVALTGCPTMPVEVAQGSVVGLRLPSAHGTVEVFKGIPYAAPPVGELRFRPPVAPEPWDAPRQAFVAGAPCLQENGVLSVSSILPPPPPPCEDCLYLNVWRPVDAGDAPLPVMVWIHGGGFQYGSGEFPAYDGAALVSEGVLVVTVNYRLGTLGFLAHPALSAESPEGVSGNYALLDTIAALEWVQGNIAAFGGDPGNVTLFGISSGAMSIGCLLAMPAAEGLFHKAIMQGGPTWPLPTLREGTEDKPSAEDLGLLTAANLGITGDGPEAAAALRALSPDEILEALNESDIFAFRLGDNPTVDGIHLPGQPVLAVQDGRANPVSLLIGANEDEASAYTIIFDEFLRWRPRDYEQFLLAFFAPDGEAVLAQYPAPARYPVLGALNPLLTDFAFLVPSRMFAEASAQNGRPTYHYHFTQRPNNIAGLVFGAHHAAEVPFVFNTLLLRSAFTDADRALAAAMRRYWTRFAKTGDPNAPGDPAWPPYTPETAAHLELGPEIRPAADLRPAATTLLTPILQDFYEGVR